MRILLIAVLLFATIHFIRIDFTEGTIPLAAFQEEATTSPCKHETEYIAVKTVPGDTIESLFALYPDPDTQFIERLADFYTLNPHLEKQGVVGNEKVYMPLSSLREEGCGK